MENAMNHEITCVCSDMAGTTVADGTAVMDSFAVAARQIGLVGPELDQAMQYALATMGQSKIEVFRAMLSDENRAQAANNAFEEAYLQIVRAGGVAAMPGAQEMMDWCRERGIKICLTTGFAPATRDAIIASLGWESQVDLLLSPADAGRGRPYPDMILAAVLKLQVEAVQHVAVIGDTSSDLLAGLRSGASVVAGVLTGPQTRADLESAPHTHILGSVAEVPEVLESLFRPDMMGS
jgi:phosphoglycolate phosphatase